MHEVSIIQSMLQMAEENARKAGGTAICAIRIRVGMLSGVVPEALEFAFEVLRKGTLAENGRLEIERVPAKFSCKQCGAVTERETPEFVCDTCGGNLVLLGEATDLEMVSLEIV